MKNLLILTAALAVFFASCSKNTPTAKPVTPAPATTTDSAIIQTIPPSNVSYTAATSGIRIINAGGKTIIHVQMRYGTDPFLVLYNQTRFNADQDSATSVTEATWPLRFIQRNTKYYVCASAVASDYTMLVGNLDSFTTPRGIFERDSFSWGVVFSVDSTYQHGIAYAMTDQSSGAFWCIGTNVLVSGASGTAIGTGVANTNAIIAAQGSGDYAAQICRNYAGGGFHDWYLPSKMELDAFHYRIVTPSSANNYYWSSTQYDLENAWCEYYNDLVRYYMDDFPKYTKMYVRAVRSF